MEQDKSRIVVISPIRDEAEFIQNTFHSVVNQTVKPLEWVIVDDGSRDDTAQIVGRMAQEYEWIHLVRKPDRGNRSVGPGVVEAFNYGYDRIQTRDYHFICKMDGDLSFGFKYFETLLNKFNADPKLGSASGKLFFHKGEGHLTEERITDESVLGGLLFFRQKCFEDIGGFVSQVMWDGIAFHRCRMAGWKTQSFQDPELRIIHHRLMGSSHKSVYHGRIRWGFGQYFMGTHPLYALAIGLYRMYEQPFILGGLLIILGYIKGWLKRTPRYDYPGYRKSLVAWQLERLGLGRRLERIPPFDPLKSGQSRLH